MIATGTDDGMAVAVTVSTLGILTSLAFLGLGWWDSRRQRGVPQGTDPEQWAESKLTPTREWQAAHNTGGGFVNPSYYSRMSHSPARHRRPASAPASDVQAWLGGVWLLLVGPVDRWRRSHRRVEQSVVPVVAPAEMRVVDPEDAPTRKPFDALINSAHVPQVFQPPAEPLAEIPRPSWDWITRRTTYLNQLARGDHDVTEPLPRIPADAETEVAA
ncbi:hypothetical protein AB0B94_30375 [Micromonospora sp. NPDC048986]|uniref:hypothetical protein n=1 Tax=Micromonospora sp. NPDC048986 TaxID=3155644 RepID=UPI0033E90653